MQYNFVFVRMKSFPCAAMIEERINSASRSSFASIGMTLRILPSSLFTTVASPSKLVSRPFHRLLGAKLLTPGGFPASYST